VLKERYTCRIGGDA